MAIPVTIHTIDSAPASAGGGLFINGKYYVDPKYDINISWKDRRITITAERGGDCYVGNIDAITFNGKSDPQTISNIIDWLKVGGIDVGGDGGFTVSITFDPAYFTGDGSDVNPISLIPSSIPISAENVLSAMDPNVFCLNSEGLITLKDNLTVVFDEVKAHRFTLLAEEESNKK